ncbi:MAG: FMN-binding protein [Chloroflexota bacterium]
MPKRGAFAIVLTAFALVVLLNFQTPSDMAAVSGTGSRPGTGTTTSGGTRTVSGPTVNTRFGPVQVAVTVVSGRITDVSAVQLPSGDRRSASISSRVEPMLRSQVLSAQSARIDGVSGATYTSIAYARSLQAALDAAGI